MEIKDTNRKFHIAARIDGFGFLCGTGDVSWLVRGANIR